MLFKGIENPEIYVLDYSAHEEDLLSNYPLSGRRGDFVCSLLGSFGILDKTRFACFEQGEDLVLNDIIKCNPKVIIGFGKELLNKFTNTRRSITDVSGSVFDIKIKDNDFKYLAVMSPSYILQKLEDTELAIKFSKDLNKAFQIVNGEYRDIIKEKEVLSAHSFEEFKNIYETKLIGDLRIAYDIETNARPPMTSDSKIIGFSIANKTSGVYVSVDSLDFHMSKDEEDKIWDYLIHNIFEKKDKLIIHNTMYERPYTYHCKGYEIGFNKADDTLTMSRLLRSPKESAGLKYQVQKNLGYPDWETDLLTYVDSFKSFVKRIGLGPKKFLPIWEKTLEFKNIFDIVFSDEFEKLKDVDKEEVLNILDGLKSPCLELYSDSEIHYLGSLMFEKIKETVDNNGLEDSTIPYNWIPDRVLSKYGALDSLGTFDLCEFYEKMMDDMSTDKVNVHEGYKNWLEHFYVAYIMERNGMYWNESLVKQDESFLYDQAITHLKSLLKSKEFYPYIYSTCEHLYRPIILSDYLPEIASNQGYKVEYSKLDKKYSVYFNNKKATLSSISSIEIPDINTTQLGQTYFNLVIQMFNDQVDNATNYEELQELYNPSSPSASFDIAYKILMTPDIQIGQKIIELHALSDSPELENEEYRNQVLSLYDQKLLKIADLLCNEQGQLKELYGDNWGFIRKELYQGFCNLLVNIQNGVVKVKNKDIITILNKQYPLVIESFDDDGIISVYNAMAVTGIDPDNEATWTSQYRWMFDFRLFKKSQKLISTYINGSVGRESVYIVDKENLRSGNHCVSRKRKRYVKDGKLIRSSNAFTDEDYVLASKWSPCTAETGRWTSPMHTVPSGSQVKKYYTSRFTGGTIVAPDYSTMEVRTLAAISKDQNMLKVLKEGKDFHTETAKAIFKKEDITPAERRFSKGATFAITYGSSIKSFAERFCKGDITYANEVFENFFNNYPDCKKWIDERHKEVHKDGRVSLELSNRFIPISSINGEGAMNRQAQNYPIQAQSADLTGGVVFDLQKYIEETDKKSLIFMYVHDSIEADVYPYEMLEFITHLKWLLNEAPERRMGLPSKADVTLGKSLGHEIELESIECNENFTEGTLKLKGYKDEIDETVNTWKQAYKTVEVYNEDFKKKLTSWGELFIKKKPYTPMLGKVREVGSCEVKIKYYE